MIQEARPIARYKPQIIPSKLIKIAFIGSFIFIVNKAWSQSPANYKSPQDWVMAKNYYFTFLLEKNPEVWNDIQRDKDIRKTMRTRNMRFRAADSCKSVGCMVQAFKWNDDEIASLKAGFAILYTKNKKLEDLVEKELIPSKTYGLKNSRHSRDYAVRALVQDMKAANYAIDIYGAGKPPNYPHIDSISFDVTKKSFLGLLREVHTDVLNDEINPMFQTMFSALRLLEMNERWDIAQLEPLISGENKAALDNIPKINFDKYPYTMILSLGAGPEVYNQPISPLGMLNCREAARKYLDGTVPLIMVSGGRVHPYKTQYIEALQMKKYLIHVLNIPEKAILIEPHARHTTTNIRNAARLMIEYKLPVDKWAIINSTSGHISYVAKTLQARCLKELGYIPFTLGKRISSHIVEFKPLGESFRIDPDEPLDP